MIGHTKKNRDYYFKYIVSVSDGRLVFEFSDNPLDGLFLRTLWMVCFWERFGCFWFWQPFGCLIPTTLWLLRSDKSLVVWFWEPFACLILRTLSLFGSDNSLIVRFWQPFGWLVSDSHLVVWFLGCCWKLKHSGTCVIPK